MRIVHLCLPLAIVLLPAVAAHTQTLPLPNAPQPIVTPEQTAGSLAHASYQKRLWSQYVDPGERVPRLTAHDKMLFWLHEEFRPSATLPAFISAGYGQLTNDAPQYGSDSGAFGERLGAAFLRQASMRFFSSSLFPFLYGEDPRYYRKASGSILSRAAWAGERVLITQRDGGSHSINGSLLVGHLAASVLTLAYYPSANHNRRVVFETWGTSLAGAAGNNLFLEFWPDLRHAWHRHREHAAPSSR